jgi:uncharacterized protein DUF6580
MSKNFNPRTKILLIFVSAVAILRVAFNFSSDISPLANFSPVGAMAIFAGAYFNKRWKAIVFPLLMLFLSDIVLQLTVYRKYGSGVLYDGWYWVYSAFCVITIVSRWILTKITINRFLVSVIVCVLIHWIISDLGVWIGSTRYPQSLNGFVMCLENAIPYECRFLAGTLLYGISLFTTFEWMKIKYTVLQTAE